MAAGVGNAHVWGPMLLAFRQIFDHVRVPFPLAPNGCVGSMPGVHDRLVTEWEDHLGDRLHQVVVVAPWQIGSPNGGREE